MKQLLIDRKSEILVCGCVSCVHKYGAFQWNLPRVFSHMTHVHVSLFFRTVLIGNGSHVGEGSVMETRTMLAAAAVLLPGTTVPTGQVCTLVIFLGLMSSHSCCRTDFIFFRCGLEIQQSSFEFLPKVNSTIWNTMQRYEYWVFYFLSLVNFL